MPRVRPRREVVRRRVLAAAREEFLREGYTDASLRRIAAAAGYTKGAIYSNFASKPQLLVEVVTDDFDGVIDHLNGLPLDPEWSWFEVAERVIDMVVGEVTRNVPIQRLLAQFALAASRDPDLAAAYRDLRRRQREAVVDLGTRRLATTGITPAVDIETAVRAIMALSTGLVVEHVATEDSPTPDRLRAMLHALLGSDSTRPPGSSRRHDGDEPDAVATASG